MDKKELKQITASVIERTKKAIKDGENEKALKLVDEIEASKHSFDASYQGLIDLMLTYIADKLGEDALIEIHRQNGEKGLWPRLGWALQPISADEIVRKRAFTWTDWHMTDINISEDPEKFTIDMKCDSGGRIRGWPQYGKTKKAQPWAWSQKGMSYYCAHCDVVLEQQAIEKCGHAVWLCNPGPEGRCTQYIYKDPWAIPEKYYERVGKEKVIPAEVKAQRGKSKPPAKMMTEQEMKSISTNIFSRLRQAIKDGQKEKAVTMVDQIEHYKRDFDESYRVWQDLMMVYIADKLGEEAVYEIHVLNGDKYLWPMFTWFTDPTTSIEDKVRRRAKIWTDWHWTSIEDITEDDEKFTFKLKCDSGGSVNQWPVHGQTKKAYPWSWGETGVSYYCAHCPVTHEIQAIDRIGRPSFLCNPQPDGYCIQYLYKEGAKIPEKYYKRVGKTKDPGKIKKGL